MFFLTNYNAILACGLADSPTTQYRFINLVALLYTKITRRLLDLVGMMWVSRHGDLYLLLRICMVKV